MPFYQSKSTTFMHPQATRRPSFSYLVSSAGIRRELGSTDCMVSPSSGLSLIAHIWQILFLWDAMDCEFDLKQIDHNIADTLDRLDRERDSTHGRTE